MDGNQLTELPEELGALTQLVELGLSDNQLTHLPRSLGMLRQHKSWWSSGRESVACVGLPSRRPAGALDSVARGAQPAHAPAIRPQEPAASAFIVSAGARQSRARGSCTYSASCHTRVLPNQNNKLAKLQSCVGSCRRLVYLNVEHNEISLVSRRVGELPQLKFLMVRDCAWPRASRSPLCSIDRVARSRSATVVHDRLRTTGCGTCHSIHA